MTNEEKEELRKKALFLTNTAYLLADMAHTCVFYADDKLNHLGKCFEKGEKMRFKKAAKLTKEAFKAVKEIRNHCIILPTLIMRVLIAIIFWKLFSW